MKKLLLLLLTVTGFSAQAQVLFNEDASSLTIGNVGSDLTGTTLGQGGWTTFIATTAVPAGQNSDFQIVDKGGSYGNAIQITGPSATNGTRWMTKSLTDQWSGRTAGNDIAEVEYEFFTGPITTSKNTMRVVFYESSARLKMLAGLMVQMDTREIRALGYIDPTTLGGTGAIGNYSLTVGGTAAAPAVLTLDANTWYKIGLSFNYATGEIKVKGANGLFDRTFQGAAALENVGELDILGAAGGTAAAPNAASSIGVFDNFVARVSATDTLGSISNEMSSGTISVYPNPANDIVTISSSDVVFNNIEMTDLNGRVVKNLSPGGVSNSEISIVDLASGIYLLKINSNNGTITKKLIVE